MSACRRRIRLLPWRSICRHQYNRDGWYIGRAAYEVGTYFVELSLPTYDHTCTRGSRQSELWSATGDEVPRPPHCFSPQVRPNESDSLQGLWLERRISGLSRLPRPRTNKIGSRYPYTCWLRLTGFQLSGSRPAPRLW